MQVWLFDILNALCRLKFAIFFYFHYLCRTLNIKTVNIKHYIYEDCNIGRDYAPTESTRE